MKKDKEWLIKEIQGLEAEISQNYPHDEMVEKDIVLGLLKQLDEPVINPESLINEIQGQFNENDYWEAEDVRDMAIDLIREFTRSGKQTILIKKPVIPQFVADYLQVCRNNYSLYGTLKADNYFATYEVRKWLNVDSRKQELFARAWLDGYEAEKEKRYYVRENNYLLCKYKDEVIDYLEAVERGVTDLVELKLTEKEIKEYDERYWAFAVPVEEAK